MYSNHHHHRWWELPNRTSVLVRAPRRTGGGRPRNVSPTVSRPPETCGWISGVPRPRARGAARARSPFPGGRGRLATSCARARGRPARAPISRGWLCRRGNIGGRNVGRWASLPNFSWMTNSEVTIEIVLATVCLFASRENTKRANFPDCVEATAFARRDFFPVPVPPKLKLGFGSVRARYPAREIFVWAS